LSALDLVLEDEFQTSRNVRWKGSCCWPAGEGLWVVKTCDWGHCTMVRPWRPAWSGQEIIQVWPDHCRSRL